MYKKIKKAIEKDLPEEGVLLTVERLPAGVFYGDLTLKCYLAKILIGDRFITLWYVYVDGNIIGIDAPDE